MIEQLREHSNVFLLITIIFPSIVGWFGLHSRQTVWGGAVALFLFLQAVAGFVAAVVLFNPRRGESVIFSWVLEFFMVCGLLSVLTIGLRRYYLTRSIDWKSNEEVKH